MKNKDIFELYEAHVAPTYKRFPVTLHSGKGASARDFEGKFFVDFASGIGVNALGFCDDGWIDAVISQLHQLQHTSNVFYNAPGALLADKLCGFANASQRTVRLRLAKMDPQSEMLVPPDATATYEPEIIA